jgi:KDO2-lipid IV(A) lauroyltransferase
MSREQLLDRIEHIEGDDRYRTVRALRKGAIIVTAHMGSFEVGMAALLEREKRVHVLFRRDALGLFEQTRSALRRRLGVNEVPVDEGLSVWLRLRDALARDEAVLIQGDRTMPGQKGRPVPFLGGHVVLPTGPVKLAMASGAPILPVFTIRLPDGRVRLFVEQPIVVRPEDSAEAALEQLASVIERYVRAYPDQWLMIHPAWCEHSNSCPVTRAPRPGQPVRTGETPVSPASQPRSPSPFNSVAQ